MLQNLELVSEFQNHLFLPNVFIMKLSSTSLIAATLTAITCSAIATPVPLHARALQQFDIEISSREAEVALVEREVYGELVDNLFTRQAKHVQSKPKPFEIKPRIIPLKAEEVLGIHVVVQPHTHTEREKKEKKGHVLLEQAKCTIKGIMCFP